MIGEDLVMTEDFKQSFHHGVVNPYGRFFTGSTHLNMLVEKDDIWNSQIANVTFDAGARTNGHKHSGGQILLVTAGIGRYQEKGLDIKNLQVGDIVTIPPNVIHWHGAAPDSDFAHISIETNIPNNNVMWLDKVSDYEYK